MMIVRDLRAALATKLLFEDFVIDKTGVRTIELSGWSFEADEPTVFGELNEDWARREVEWYESRSLNVNDIEEPVPEIWRKVAATDGTIVSNYGWMVYSEENGHQYDFVRDELAANPFSRRATMIYNRPTMHVDAFTDGRQDFCCTMGVHYQIRDGQLDAIVQMRSNDLIFGYKGDLHWQKHVQRKLAADLGVEVGDVVWNAASGHVYERHFYLVDHWDRTGEVSVTKKRYAELYPDSEWAR